MDTIGPGTKKPTTTRQNGRETSQTRREPVRPESRGAPNDERNPSRNVGVAADVAGGSNPNKGRSPLSPSDTFDDISSDTTSTANRATAVGTASILWFVRIAFAVALAVTVAFPEWEQFAGKGMAFRVPFYALPMGIVPLVWKLRGSHGRYPWLVDLLVFSPFFVDTLGNVFNFYNNFNQTDDVLHFANWVLLMGGITIGFGRLHLGKLVSWTLGWGLGALAIIWWEVAEFLVQEMGTAGLSLTYEDTVGDLVLSSTGGAVGAFLAVTFAWPSSARRETPSPS